MISVVFDGPPGPIAGRFVEVENEAGESINLGEWVELADPPGWWTLRFELPDMAPATRAIDATKDYLAAATTLTSAMRAGDREQIEICQLAAQQTGDAMMRAIAAWEATRA